MPRTATSKAQPSVLLVGNYLPDGQQSMQRYAELLYGELLSQGVSVQLVRPEAVFGRWATKYRQASKLLANIDKYVVFPLRLRVLSRRYDVVHICDHSNAFYLHQVSRASCLITCHDLFSIKGELGHYPQMQGASSLQYRRRIAWTLSSIRASRNVVCVSDKTRDDLEALLQGGPTRLVTIPHPLNRDFADMSEEQIRTTLARVNPAISTKYFVHVGGNQWYKNRAGVIRIFRGLQKLPQFRDAQLVMAGKPWTTEMRSLCSDTTTQDVLEVINPSNEEVQALYSGAMALLFPSLYEGFGWPILEAQACKCPVVTSDRAPMTEIAGASAIFIDPENPEAAASKVGLELGRRSSLIRAGLENLERFGKESIIARYCDLYQEIASGV
ncbi:Glycosyltransferase [Acidisarcina polymorpha]|uniref:Glycosyltransferase n=1 Tax=Acidisarcina polymorpha TaxID=2211140 RepID=A0A2Z5G3S6_9BACT|nr:glycosyltransferase family 1 protein [Acidisarcina polymorpha]AXC13680.1 Glycosyltransferase [Acidisarcina polymorpha]